VTRKEIDEMKTALLAAAVVAAAALGAALTLQRASAEGLPRAQHHRARPSSHARKRSLQVARSVGSDALAREIVRYRRMTWHWQAVLGRSRSPAGSSERDPSRAYRLWALTLWKHRAGRLWAQARRPPHRSQWLCIHRYEGAWNDDGAPYYGGLQMDIGFQQAYGAYLLHTKGTANRWTPLEQMWVAERAHRTRGFSPWPSTARVCGLI
jgi:hypothetical protein